MMKVHFLCQSVQNVSTGRDRNFNSAETDGGSQMGSNDAHNMAANRSHQQVTGSSHHTSYSLLFFTLESFTRSLEFQNFKTSISNNMSRQSSISFIALYSLSR